jgi:hypothetical protein
MNPYSDIPFVVQDHAGYIGSETFYMLCGPS